MLYILILLITVLITCGVVMLTRIIKSAKKNKETLKMKQWQLNRLVSYVYDRIDYIKSTGKSTSRDEIEALLSIKENVASMSNFNDLASMSKTSNVYSIISIAIMDRLYTSPLDTLESKKEFLLNLSFLDLINGGVLFNGKYYEFYPLGLNKKKTIELILNRQEELTEIEKELLVSDTAKEWAKRSPDTYKEYYNELLGGKTKDNYFDMDVVEKVIVEMEQAYSLNNLSDASKYVISRTILELLANTIYKGDNRQLTENEKIYIRILHDVISGKSYEDLYLEVIK